MSELETVLVGGETAAEEIFSLERAKLPLAECYSPYVNHTNAIMAAC